MAAIKAGHQTREEMIREILQDSNVSLLEDNYSEDGDEHPSSSSSSSSSSSDSYKSVFKERDSEPYNQVMSSVLSVNFNSNRDSTVISSGHAGAHNSNSEVSNNGGSDSTVKSPNSSNDVVKDSSNSNNINNNSKSANNQMSSQQSHEQNDESSVQFTRLEQPSRSKATGMSVRCHCNLASCVTNNYMCKSERRVTEDGKELEAGCFVQELENDTSSSSSAGGSSSQQQQQSQQHGVSVPMWNGRVATARRGCIEMLSREKQEKCSDKAGDQVHCCTQDMCNYPKSFYPSPNIQNFNSNRPTFDSSSSSSSSSSSGMRGIAGMTPNLDHQVWLRAAVIAVPICGLMILVVLIVVARRLLQSDDYKDGRSYSAGGGSSSGRRKASSSSALPPLYQSSAPYPHHTYLPPSSIIQGSGGGQRSPYHVQDSFHSKPVYMETSEYLLPPNYCSHCQQAHTTSSHHQHHHHPHGGSSSSHARSSTASSSSYSHETTSSCRNNNSETEQLVHSSCSNSHGINNGNNSCHCSGGGVVGSSAGADTPHLSDDGSNSSSSDPQHTRSYSWNSIQPPSIFSGSSPELPAIHRQQQQHGNNNNHKNLNHFLSKIGLSRSTQSDNNPLHTRPYNV